MASNGANLNWRPAAAEGIATFFFVLLGAGSVLVTGALTGGEMTAARLTAIAVAHGLAIAMLVAAVAHLSGGHINPAVTIPMMITKKIGVKDAFRALYCIVKFGLFKVKN